MVVSDERRRILREGLVQQLGAEVADALMEHLPPAGWADLATKQDVSMSETRLRMEMAEMKADLRAEISKQTRAIIIAMVAMTCTLVGSFTGVVASTAR